MLRECVTLVIKDLEEIRNQQNAHIKKCMQMEDALVVIQN